MTPPPFAERLDAARRLVAAARKGALPAPPLHVGDQLAAAALDAHVIAHRLAQAMRVAEPERAWGARRDYPGEADVRILAALGGCRLCPHLHQGGPQPAWAVLALRRVDCGQCCRAQGDPPDDEADRCDWCGARGVTTFRPLAFQRGPLVVIGDACPECSTALVPVTGARP